MKLSGRNFLFGLIFLTGLFNNCINNNPNNSNYSENITNCHGDSLERKRDTIKYNFDTKVLNNTVCSIKDENGVWFENISNDQLRIVYQSEKKLLLVYNNQQLFKKHFNAIALKTSVKVYKCKNGIYEYGFTNEFISVFNNKNEIIMDTYIYQFDEKINIVEYNYSDTKKYKLKGRSSALFGVSVLEEMYTK